MSVLLDTHIWIWWVNGEKALPQRERTKLNQAAAAEVPSLADFSLWEAQMLYSKKRLLLRQPFAQWLVEASLPDTVTMLRLSPHVILELQALPTTFPGDPADRLIVATARAYGLALHTHDEKIRRSGLVKLWKPG